MLLWSLRFRQRERERAGRARGIIRGGSTGRAGERTSEQASERSIVIIVYHKESAVDFRTRRAAVGNFFGNSIGRPGRLDTQSLSRRVAAPSISIICAAIIKSLCTAADITISNKRRKKKEIRRPSRSCEKERLLSGEKKRIFA